MIMSDNVIPAETWDEEEPQTEATVSEDAVSTPKKVFRRDMVVRDIKVSLHMPKLYPDIEPWEFRLRLKLSDDAEERRQEYLSFVPAEQTVKAKDQALDEVCDLLMSLPKGFEDLKDTGKGPGHSFRSYLESAEPEAKATLYQIVEGVSGVYWRTIMPYEFRK